eukprot:5742808-Amphidinium_carterae.1
MGYLQNDNSGSADLQYKKACNDNSGRDAIVAKIMEWQLWIGRLSCQTNGMTTGWEAFVAKTMKSRVWMGYHYCQNHGMTTLHGMPLLLKNELVSIYDRLLSFVGHFSGQKDFIFWPVKGRCSCKGFQEVCLYRQTPFNVYKDPLKGFYIKCIVDGGIFFANGPFNPRLLSVWK